MCMCLHLCVYTCVEVLRGQKRASDPLELESLPVVSHHWVLGTEPESSPKVACALKKPPSHGSTQVDTSADHGQTLDEFSLSLKTGCQASLQPREFCLPLPHKCWDCRHACVPRGRWLSARPTSPYPQSILLPLI